MLVVDDSAVARRVISEILTGDPRIQVVGTAADPFEAREKIATCDPQVLTLDVEMPRMDGIEFLRRMMPVYPLPVVVVSSLTTRGAEVALQAIEAGAVDVVPKPTRNLSWGIEAMVSELRSKVLMAATVRVARHKRAEATTPSTLATTTDKILAIGASTGGTEAIRVVLQGLPANGPATVIVQHMPPGFTAAFANRLDEICPMKVKEARPGDRLFAGRALVAPAGLHLEVVRSGGEYHVELSEGAKVSGHRPSVDVMFRSVAQAAGKNAVGALLTGMGADGADGLLAMHQAGAATFAQDEATSVVWGMPRAAYERGATNRLVPLGRMSELLTTAF